VSECIRGSPRFLVERTENLALGAVAFHRAWFPSAAALGLTFLLVRTRFLSPIAKPPFKRLEEMSPPKRPSLLFELSSGKELSLLE